jgi:hypothetical protein
MGKMANKQVTDMQPFLGKDGHGFEIVDKNRYEGEFKDGLPHGYGKKTWGSGDSYGLPCAAVGYIFSLSLSLSHTHRCTQTNKHTQTHTHTTHADILSHMYTQNACESWQRVSGRAVRGMARVKPVMLEAQSLRDVSRTASSTERAGIGGIHPNFMHTWPYVPCTHGHMFYNLHLRAHSHACSRKR